MISSTNEGFKAINPFLNEKKNLHFALLLQIIFIFAISTIVTLEFCNIF